MKIKIERNFKKFGNFQFVLPIEDLAPVSPTPTQRTQAKMKKYTLTIITALTVGFVILPIPHLYIHSFYGDALVSTDWYWQILDPRHWFGVFNLPAYPPLRAQELSRFQLQQVFLCLIAVLLVSIKRQRPTTREAFHAGFDAGSDKNEAFKSGFEAGRLGVMKTLFPLYEAFHARRIVQNRSHGYDYEALQQTSEWREFHARFTKLASVYRETLDKMKQSKISDTCEATNREQRNEGGR